MGYPQRGWRRVAWREFRMIRGSSQAILVGILLPILSSVFLAAIFWASVPRKLPVAVVDEDLTSLSRRASRMVDAVPGLRVAFQESDPSEGFRRVRKGDAYAVVLLPRHLERDVAEGRSPAIGIYVNNQMLLPGSLVYRDLRTALGTLAAGVKIQVHRKTGEARREAEKSYDPVRLESHALFLPELDYRCFLVPALAAALLQIFTLFASLRALGREIKRKTVGLWWRHAGRRDGPALFGKLLPHALIHALVSFTLLAGWHVVWGNPLAGSFLVEWAALSMMGWVAQGVAVFMVGWTADYRLSLSMGAFFASPAMAFAGVSFPLAAMNGSALGWSSMLPLSHGIKIVVDQSLRGTSLRAEAAPFLALALLGVFFVLSTWRRWGRVFADRSEWGQS